MLLDKREITLENLDCIKKAYLKLIILKHLQQDACEGAFFENLHEFTENERLIIEDINGIMKYIVPNLVILKGDPRIREKVSEIDRLQTSIIQRSLGLRKNLSKRIIQTKKSLENLKKFSVSPLYSIPAIVNMRA